MPQETIDLFAVSFSVCTLISAVVVYLIFRRNKRKLRWSDILYLGHVFVLACLLCAIYGYIHFSLLFREVKRPFDQTAWMSDQTKRVEMLDDLIDSGKLKNMKRNEVLQLLGTPMFADTVKGKTRLFYYTGFKRQFLEIDPFLLRIELEKDSVIKYFSKASG